MGAEDPTNRDRTPSDMETTATPIDGLVVIRMREAGDGRGVVREMFRASALREAGLSGFGEWKQFNITETKKGAVRGLHGEAMWKLVALASGEALGVYVDVRPDSPTRGIVHCVPLRRGIQVLVPSGVCNGFQSTSDDDSQYVYCFDEEWTPTMAGRSVTPLDPDLGVTWPIPVNRSDRTCISEKDASAPLLHDVLEQHPETED